MDRGSHDSSCLIGTRLPYLTVGMTKSEFASTLATSTNDKKDACEDGVRSSAPFSARR